MSRPTRVSVAKPRPPEKEEIERLKEPLAELQERERQRDPAYRPKHDLRRKDR